MFDCMHFICLNIINKWRPRKEKRQTETGTKKEGSKSKLERKTEKEIE